MSLSSQGGNDIQMRYPNEKDVEETPRQSEWMLSSAKLVPLRRISGV